MKKIIFIIAALLTTALAASAQDVLGKWKLENGSAIVQVYQSGESYNGKIVWLKEATEKDGSPAVDRNNPDPAKQTRKLIGLNMLSGLKKTGDEYTGGRIYDPANGKTYYCSFKVEGNTLRVRGSLDKKGLLGRTMNWYRVK